MSRAVASCSWPAAPSSRPADPRWNLGSLFKQTAEQVVWQDGCFSVSAEAKWDENRCGRDIVLSNNNTTVTRSNGNEWYAQLIEYRGSGV